MTSYYFYPYTSLTGGNAESLDSLDGNLVKNGDGALVITGNEYIAYTLDEDNGNNESVPDIISPDTNAGNKRWVRVSSAIDGKIDTVTGQNGMVAYFNNNGHLNASTVNYNNLQNATKIQSKNVAATAPADGQLMRYNNSAPAWEPSEIGIWRWSGVNVYNNNGWPTTWQDLDLSSACGNGRSLVQLEVINGASTVGLWACRMKGAAYEVGRDQDASRGAGAGAGSMLANQGIVVTAVTASNGIIQIWSSNNSANSNINVLTYVRLE
jgi:hypothetical protein